MGAVLVLAGPVSAARPQGYVPGKDFTAVSSIQTRQQSAWLKSQYTYHSEMCVGEACAHGCECFYSMQAGVGFKWVLVCLWILVMW